MIIDYEELDLSKKSSEPIVEDQYKKLLAKFIDEVFECDSLLKRETFINEVATK